MFDFVDRLVAIVAVGDGKFRAFLEVDDEGHRDTRVAGPARRRLVAPITEEVAP
jgi:hypothetical protein